MTRSLVREIESKNLTINIEFPGVGGEALPDHAKRAFVAIQRAKVRGRAITACPSARRGHEILLIIVILILVLVRVLWLLRSSS